MPITSAVSTYPLISQALLRTIDHEQSVAQPMRGMQPTQHDAARPKHDAAQPGRFQRFAAEAGKNLWFIPGMNNALQEIAKARPGLDGIVSAALDGLHKTRGNGFDKMLLGAASKNFSAVGTGYMETVIKNEATPESVRKLLREGSSLLGLAALLRQQKYTSVS